MNEVVDARRKFERARDSSAEYDAEGLQSWLKTLGVDVAHETDVAEDKLPDAMVSIGERILGGINSASTSQFGGKLEPWGGDHRKSLDTLT